MSLDGTVWLWHDPFFPDEQSQVCIPMLHDHEILSLQLHDKPLVALDTVLRWMSLHAQGKIISLDVKGYFPLAQAIDLTAYFDRLSDSIVAIVSRYSLKKQVYVETDYQQFLDFMSIKCPDIERYLLAYTDLRNVVNICVNKLYTGVSFVYHDTSFTRRNILYLKSKGKKIQVWTIRTKEEIDLLKSLNVDVIQSDLIVNVKNL